MKLDRNGNGTGRGKYALIKTRRIVEIEKAGNDAVAQINSGVRDELIKADRAAITLDIDVSQAISTLEAAGVLEWGEPGTEGEFFVIKLRDQHARAALWAYADDIGADLADVEYRKDIRELAFRAGPDSPFCKKPD